MDRLNELFNNAKDKVLGNQRGNQGIGSLSEKTVHAILKNMYEPAGDYQEVAVLGYVADICKGNEIIEIQTANFNKMRAKLEKFLPEYNVTIVYPVPHLKWLLWIDNETGEVSKKRKSPKTGNVYTVFYELYKIKQFLKNENLRFKIVLMDVEEYRLLDGWSEDKKKGSHRYDRIPCNIAGEVSIDCIQDYVQLIPYDLPEQFSSKDYAKAAKVSTGVAGLAVNILNYLEVIKIVSKKGNAYIYEVVE